MFPKVFLYLIAILSIGFGVWIYRRPLDVFEMQRKFYAMINWRIEPISIEKEIRNTKLMGIFLIIIVIMCLAYQCFKS